MSLLGNALSEELEFRTYKDDAWYTVRVQLDGDVLRVKFSGFSADQDDTYDVNDISSSIEVEDLEARFRPLSVQLQDSECSEVVHGLAVCASFPFRHDDLRFYDAVVEEVGYREHSSENGEEECLCRFILFWQHGPNARNLTANRIENMCRIQSSALNNAMVANFLKKARERVQSNNYNSTLQKDCPTHDGGTCQEENHSSSIKHNPPFPQWPKQETKVSRLSAIKSWPDEDSDFGGVKSQYMILVENLDKGLSPSKVAEFLYDLTSIFPQVYIFPCSSFESYARAAIVVNCKENLDTLYDILDNPDYIIISSHGRPLVATEKIARRDACVESTGILLRGSTNKVGGLCSELKVVSAGTKEYQTAKQRKGLLMEFIAHQRRLHQRFAMDETEMT